MGLSDPKVLSPILVAKENLLKAIEDQVLVTIASAEVIHRNDKKEITCMHLKNIDGQNGLLVAKLFHLVGQKGNHENTQDSMNGFASGSSYVNDVFEKVRSAK